MMQKAFLIALAALMWPRGVEAAADAPFIEKQFSRIDSSLAQLVALPQARMKEVAPFDDAAKQVLAKYPEIASVMRTNSKGIVVNCVWRANGETKIHADVSGFEWYSAPAKTLDTYYGKLHKENSRSFLIWSRPLFINTTIGGRRFGGVIAVSLDVTLCFNRFAAAAHGPFKVLLGGKSFYYISWNDNIAYDETRFSIPGDIQFTLRVPKKGNDHVQGAALIGGMGKKENAPALKGPVPDTIETARKPAAHPATFDKQEPKTETDPEMQAVPVSPPAHHAGQASMILRVAGAGAIILVGFCLWLIISTLRKQRLAPLGEEKIPSGSLSVVPETNEQSTELEVDAVKSEGDAAAGIQPAYVDIPAFVPAGVRERIAAEDLWQPLVQPTAFSPAQETAPEEVGIEGTKIPETAEQGAYNEVAGEMRAEITDEQRNEIYKKELESMTAAIRQQLIDNEMAGLIEKLRRQFSDELHRHIAETMTATIEEQERKAVEKEVAEKVRAEEYEAIRRDERRKLSESVRASLAEEESGRLAAEAMENLKNEIVAKVRAGEEDAFVARARDELAAEIHDRLLEEEKERIVRQQRQKLETDLYAEVSQQQRDSIRETVIAQITEEEHQRIDAGLRKTILENEKKRIIDEESPAFREEIRKQLRDSERDAMHSTVRDEIYSETVQAIKQNLEDKYRTVVEEKMRELKVMLQKKTKSDISTAISADYDRLMEHIEQLSASLTNIEALQSLSQTITLLSDEKKKYKYLNLNSAQTESLLEYLKRVHNRLNIFFDKVDESVRNLMLYLGSVKNKLEDNE
jgi:hypothetical protein